MKLQFKNPFSRKEIEAAQFETNLAKAQAASNREHDQQRIGGLQDLLTEQKTRFSEQAEELREAHQLISVMHDAHTEKHRVASVRLDPLRLEADLRRVMSNVKVEYDSSTFLYVVYSREEPREESINAIRAVFQAALEIDRT